MRIKTVDRRNKKRRGPKNIYLVADNVNIISKGGVSPPVGYGAMGGVSGGGKRQYHFGFDPVVPPASVTGAPDTVETQAPQVSQNLIQNSLGRLGTMLGSAALSYASQAFLNQASGWGGSDTFNNSTSPNMVDASTTTMTPNAVSVGVGNDVAYELGDTPGTVVRVDQGVQATPISQQPDVVRATQSTQTGFLMGSQGTQTSPFTSVTQGTSMGGGFGGASMGTQTSGVSSGDFGMQTKPSLMSSGMQTKPSLMSSGMQTMPYLVGKGGVGKMPKGKAARSFATQAGYPGLDMGSQATAAMSSMGTQAGYPPIPPRPAYTMTDKSIPISRDTQTSTSLGVDASIQAVDPKLARTVGTQAATITQAGTVGMGPATASTSTQAIDPQIAAMKKELENYHERLLTTGADASTVLALNGALGEMLQEAQSENSNTSRILSNTLSYLETFLDQVVGDPRWRDLMDRSQPPDAQIQQIFGMVAAKDPNLREFVKRFGMFADKIIAVEHKGTSPISPRPPIPMRPASTMTERSVPIGRGTQTSEIVKLKKPRSMSNIETQTSEVVRLKKPKSMSSIETQTSEVLRLKKPKATAGASTQTSEILRLKMPKATSSSSTQTGNIIRLKVGKRAAPPTAATSPARRVRTSAPKPPPIRTTNLPKSAQNRTGLVPQGRAEPKSAPSKGDTLFKTTRKSGRAKK